jgi:hypothetical protein
VTAVDGGTDMREYGYTYQLSDLIAEIQSVTN